MAAAASARYHALADPLAAHVLGGLAIGGAEAVRLGGLDLGLTLLAMFAGTGLLVGATVLASEAIAARRGGSWVRALPVVAILAPVAHGLFEGAFASTLPFARVMPVVLPLAGWLATVAVIAGGARLVRSSTAGRMAAGGAVIAILGALAWSNRHLFRSGYPEVHTALTLSEVILVGVAMRIVAGPGVVRGRARLAIAAVIVGAAAVALAIGLGAERDRRVLATDSDDGRALVRLWRSILDVDRDGASAVLGGGDCDDRDPDRHPGARDIPGDGHDQDCDGVDSVPPPPPVAAVEAASLAEWRATPAVASALARTQKMNLLIVSIDALRADLLAADAIGRTDFPNLCALLAESVWFDRAFAPAAGTDLSLATVVTGRWDPFQSIATTLPEALRASGRATTAILPREVLRYAGETLLARGVDDLVKVVTDGAVRDVGDRVSAAETTAGAIAALDRAATASGGRPGRFAIWAHYFDVHEHLQLARTPAQLARVAHHGANPVEHGYRALLVGIDDEVGRLRRELAARGHADDTLVVLFSDHGESLKEDPRLPDNHGLVVYEAMVRVPVAIHVPGVTPAVVNDPVGLVDLPPTLLDLLGAAGAMTPLDGVDLVPHLLGAPVALRPAERTLVMHEQDQWGVVAWPWKLLVRPADNLVELYDLAVDPRERNDRSRDEPDRVRDLRARYGQFPEVNVDRSRAGRRWREQQAIPPPRPPG